MRMVNFDIQSSVHTSNKIFSKWDMWQSCVEIEGYSVAYFDFYTGLPHIHVRLGSH